MSLCRCVQVSINAQNSVVIRRRGQLLTNSTFPRASVLPLVLNILVISLLMLDVATSSLVFDIIDPIVLPQQLDLFRADADAFEAGWERLAGSGEASLVLVCQITGAGNVQRHGTKRKKTVGNMLTSKSPA